MTSNHYQILEVSPSASQKQIKQAYRRLAKQFHPDTQGDSANHEKIIRLNTAYEILGDPERREHYDRQFTPNYRQQRTADAQSYYKRRREAQQATGICLESWLQEIYVPTHRLIDLIINSLESQIDYLAADPFDDQLMTAFQEYLHQCRIYLQQAKSTFSSQPNPPQAAKVAASLYFCLNQVGDGIDELEWFVLNYDDSHLHTGTELFRIAQRLLYEAQEMVHYLKY